MNTLKGLSPAARVVVTEDFRRGNPPTAEASDFISDLELGRTINLRPLRAVLDAAMANRLPRDSDAWLGPRVHATLRLTRREAADRRIWQYLTVVEFPHYVRWRWANPDYPEDPVPLDRFLGEDSKNALARLWWAAEMTRNGSSYARTERALSTSRFSISWLHLILMHHRAAALAVVDFLHGFQGKGVTDTQGGAMAKATNVALRTVCLDALAISPPPDGEAIQEWIAEKIDETTMMDELPQGPDEAPVPEADVAAVRKFLDDLAGRIKLSEGSSDRRGRESVAP